MSNKWSRQTVSQSCGQPARVCTRPKRGAPWQFNNLRCHLGAITLPLVTVIVIISGQNILSVLITHNRLCSSLPGTVGSSLNVMLFHIRAIFTSSQYHPLIFQLWSLSPSALSLPSALRNWELLDFSLWVLSSDKRSRSYPSLSTVLILFFLHSFPSLTYTFHLHTHYKAAVTVNNNIRFMKSQKIVCPPPHHWTK